MIRLTLPILLLVTGLTSRYSPGVMQATINARIEMGQLSAHSVAAHDGYVAVLDCGRIGDTLWIMVNDGRNWQTGELVDGGRWQRVLVTDCAARQNWDGTQEWMRANNILTELDYQTAARYGFTHLGAVPVVVSEVRPMIEVGR